MVTRVLIAEDEPNIVESLIFILSRAGFEVTSATDGDVALSMIRDTKPDVVILDVMLPSRNGFEVMKSVRADAVIGGTPIIILTAKGQSRDRRMAEEIGANAFVTKPFSNQDILDKVRELAGA